MDLLVRHFGVGESLSRTRSDDLGAARQGCALLVFSGLLCWATTSLAGLPAFLGFMVAGLVLALGWSQILLREGPPS